MRKFEVFMEIPDGASVEETAAYVHDAVCSMGGGLRPPRSYGQEDDGDPLYGSHTCEVRFRLRNEVFFID